MWSVNRYSYNPRGGTNLLGGGYMPSQTTYLEPEAKVSDFDDLKQHFPSMEPEPEPEPILELKENKKYLPGERLLKKLNKKNKIKIKKERADDINIRQLEKSIQNILKIV
jgi:hypothetical protein